MIKFINALTHTEMWVADERKEEYLEAGHKLASEICAKPTKVEEEAKPEKRTPAKKKK